MVSSGVIIVLAFLTLISVKADVLFSTPAASSSYAPGSILAISWQESGKTPLLSALTNYVINLCAGGNSAGSFQCSLAVLKQGGSFADGNQLTGTTVAATWGQDAINGYFLQIISTSTSGEQVINYSPRFTLASMSGTLPAIVIAGISSLPAGTTSGPEAFESNPAASADSDSTTAIIDPYANSYMIPYEMQTGPTRYAPMPPIPGTKITAKSASMAHPTSSASVATTYLPPATQWQTTTTQSQTFSVSSRENTASAITAATAADPMERWLNRWKD